MAHYRLAGPWGSGSWSALDEFRREMDSLLSRFGPAGVGSVRATAFPPVNLYETDEAYVLTAELPGVDPDAIQVSIEGTTVSLGGERRIEPPDDARTSVHRLERQSGAFRRAFELPAPIDADKAEAAHRNGILLLRLPKTAQHQPRQISVSAE